MHPLLESLGEKVLTVGEYLELVNGLMSPLRVSVEGEVTDLKVLPQWTFFSLKDSETGALLRCGLHSGVYRRLGVLLDEGMTVAVEGYGKISEKSGNFGFWVSKIEPLGEGALKRAYELLLKKLSEEGMFTRKRALPAFIDHIGVISSRNGVVIQDLRKNLKPLGIRIDFLHSGVEGPDSAGELLAAIEHFSTTPDRPQVLILIRGGGSLESLQGFNNEAVCRAIFAAPMPVVVGIGHDVDAPIATMVADVSASTPTAVAHVINTSWAALTERVPLLRESILQRFTMRLSEIGYRSEFALRTMRHAVARIIARFDRYAQVLEGVVRRIPTLCAARVRDADQVLTRIRSRVRYAIERAQSEVGGYERVLSASDPTRVLKRGYSLVYTHEGALVRSVADLKKGDTMTTRLGQGTIVSTVEQLQD